MKRLTALIIVSLMTASMFTGCGKTDDTDSRTISKESVTSIKDSQVSDETSPDEIVPNAESDFVWHVLAAEETTNPKCVGGVVITSYVGESDKVVIPKTIDDKPVVAIGEFAFSPSSFDDWYYSDYEYSEAFGYKPERVLVDYLGLSEKYERLDAEATAEIEKLGISYRDIDRYCDEWDMYFNSEEDLLILIDKFEEIGKSDIAQYLEKYTYNGHEYFSRDRDEDDDNIESVYITEHSRYAKEIISALEEAPKQSDLKSVLLPDSVSLIGGAAFAFCDSLEKVLVYGLDDGEVPVIGSGICTSNQKDDYVEGLQFFACSKLKETNFYMNVYDGYGSQCYDYCISLEKVYLYPTEEGGIEFQCCIPHSYKISEVIIADGTTSIFKFDSDMSYPFKDCTFYVPASVTKQGKHSFCQHNVYEFGDTDVSEGTECSYDGITIITPAGSYAERFAKENGIKHISE